MFLFIFGILIVIAGIVLAFLKEHIHWGVAVGALVLGVALLFVSFIAIVDTGHIGIVTTFGQVENYTYEPGLHFVAPWHQVTEMDNRVQKQTVELSCFSSDIQEVKMVYTINYQVDKENAQHLYQTVGMNYYEVVVKPAIAEATKIITARYTAEQLVQERNNLAEGIEQQLLLELKESYINVVSTAIEDLDFTDAFTNAVEAKQVAEQKKKQAIIEQEQALLQQQNENEIAIQKAEADAEVAKKRAEADKSVAQIGADSAEYQGKKEAAITLQRLASLNGWTVVTQGDLLKLYKVDGTEVTPEELAEGSKRLIEYYYIESWNGELPDYYVGSENVTSIVGLK